MIIVGERDPLLLNRQNSRNDVIRLTFLASGHVLVLKELQRKNYSWDCRSRNKTEPRSELDSEEQLGSMTASRHFRGRSQCRSNNLNTASQRICDPREIQKYQKLGQQTGVNKWLPQQPKYQAAAIRSKRQPLKKKRLKRMVREENLGKQGNK